MADLTHAHDALEGLAVPFWTLFRPTDRFFDLLRAVGAAVPEFEDAQPLESPDGAVGVIAINDSETHDQKATWNLFRTINDAAIAALRESTHLDDVAVDPGNLDTALDVGSLLLMAPAGRRYFRTERLLLPTVPPGTPERGGSHPIYLPFRASAEFARVFDSFADTFRIQGFKGFSTELIVEGSVGNIVLSDQVDAAVTLEMIHHDFLEWLIYGGDERAALISDNDISAVRAAVQANRVIYFSVGSITSIGDGQELDNLSPWRTLETDQVNKDAQTTSRNEEANRPPSQSDEGELLASMAELGIEPIIAAARDLGVRLASDIVTDNEGTVREAQVSALAQVAVYSALINEAKRVLDSRALDARKEQLSWARIGRAAGIASQVAQRRWDPEAKAKHAEYQRSRRTRSD